MQNWETMQSTNDPNSWYNSMFMANIKTEPGTMPSNAENHQTMEHLARDDGQQVHNLESVPTSHLECYLNQQSQQENLQRQQQNPSMFAPLDNLVTNEPAMQNGNDISPVNGVDQQHHQVPAQHQQLQAQQQQQQQEQQQQLYKQHFLQAQQSASQNQITSHLSLGFNPLTPPGLPNAVIPAMPSFYPQNTVQPNQQAPSTTSGEQDEKGSILTPRHTPPMDITPPKSPKSTAAAAAEAAQPVEKEDQDLVSNSSEDAKQMNESEYDEYIRTPIYNSHGKMKTHKCKTCGLMSITKVAFWEHTRTHENPEKILLCPKCPFWAKVKHHLEFHICKHKNLKPFECDKCDYSCENKSMLASHRKKHSSVYQYRCADCDYATKFCHAFKQHLRKYEHKPGVVLDEEGVPNPTVVIDVYGTRRGPKSKSSTSTHCGKRSANGELKAPSESQLSAALQGFVPSPNPSSQLNQQPSNSNFNPIISNAPTNEENLAVPSADQPVIPVQNTTMPNAGHAPVNTVDSAAGLPNLLPPLDTLLQQNHNMTLLSYWNLNLQMLAAQQHAAVLAQLSPQVREELLKQQAELEGDNAESNDECDEESDHETFEDTANEPESYATAAAMNSAIDLSQATPTKKENWHHQTQDASVRIVNLQKLTEAETETPAGIHAGNTGAKRKGRVLNLDQVQHLSQVAIAEANAEDINKNSEMPTTSKASTAPKEVDAGANSASKIAASSVVPKVSAASTASAASSSSSSSSAGSANGNNTQTAMSGMFECKYCDIFFKDAVLYTIHMGYHSCDDVFKCNMCGEKCDGPVGLFVHMARNAHS